MGWHNRHRPLCSFGDTELQWTKNSSKIRLKIYGRGFTLYDRQGQTSVIVFSALQDMMCMFPSLNSGNTGDFATGVHSDDNSMLTLPIRTRRPPESLQIITKLRSCPDSSVGTATSYGMDCRGSFLSRGKKFIYSTSSRPALPLPIQCIPGVKRTRRDADHSPAYSAE